MTPGTHPGSSKSPTRRFPWNLVVLALLLVAGIAATGRFYSQRQEAHVRHAADEMLTAIANLKCSEILRWREEQLHDARFVADNPLFIREAQRFLDGSPSPRLRADLSAWMYAFQRQLQYDRILLVDGQRRVRLWLPEEEGRLGPTAQEFITQAFATHDIVLSDLYRSQISGRINLDIWVPLMPAPNVTNANLKPFALLLLELNPNEFLYPMIQSWPTPSRTAETLILRREGDEVLFLNELRQRTNTALTLRLPMKQPNFPAALAAQGQEGVVEGVDYRGIPVLAAIRKIPGTPWFMVAKVDQDEIYAPLRQRTWMTGLLAGVLMLAAILGVGVLWRQRELMFSRRELAERKRAEQDIHRLNAELEQRVRERTAELEAANRELEAFTYSVSHDLRSPLRGIDGFSQALMEDCATTLDAVCRGHLDRVRAATQRMGELIDDLLRLSLVTRGELRREPMDLSGMAQSIAHGLQEHQPQRQVEFVIAPGLTAIGDARLMQVVLENLLSNAWKFTSKHPRARIEVGVSHYNGQCAFFVRDDGAGFDMAHAGKLFGVFQRLHNQTEFEGTGVGLAMVQRIVHRHGGRAWAESVVEQGATVYFTLQTKELK